MADRRELDKQSAAVAAYYLGVRQRNCLTSSQTSGCCHQPSSAQSSERYGYCCSDQWRQHQSDYLNDSYPGRRYYLPGGGFQSPSYVRFNYWANSVLNGNFGSYMMIGRYNGGAFGIPADTSTTSSSSLHWTGQASRLITRRSPLTDHQAPTPGTLLMQLNSLETCTTGLRWTAHLILQMTMLPVLSPCKLN